MISEIPYLLSGNLSAIPSHLDVNNIMGVAIRMALIGLLAAAVRQAFTITNTQLKDYLFPTAYITASDPAWLWLMSFLAQSPEAQAQIRSFRLHTADNRQSKRDDANRLTSSKKKQEELSVARKDATFVGGDIVGQVLPVNGQSIRLRHNGTYIWITRKGKDFARSDRDQREDHLEICGLAFQPNGIKDFLVDAHGLFFKKTDDEILIFNVSGTWLDPIARPSRSWKSVIIPENIKDPLLEDVRGFLSDEEKAWYSARGIPHRRGYLLHGPPGCGKTTIATAIASELHLDIYIVNPAARGMDDGKLNKAFRNCPPQNMILIEDIDCVMPPRPRRGKGGDEEDSDDEDDSGAGNDNADPGKWGLAKSTVTLSGLLNAIDGVSSADDCILFATTNHPERLDPALSRPGRFDVHRSFSNATLPQAHDLFLHFFPLSDFGVNSSTPFGEKSELIVDQEELNGLANQFAEAVFSTSSQSSDATPSSPVGQVDLVAEVFAPLAQNAAEDDKELCSPAERKDELANFEFTISMAALQGYLLGHKKSPRAAADSAGDWAKEVKNEQTDRERKRLQRKKLRDAVRSAVTPLTPISESGK